MMIINADDWGRTIEETDATLGCLLAGTITSATAMVFMQDSERASQIAKERDLPVGLHLNLSQNYTQGPGNVAIVRAHEEVVRFMKRSKFSMFLYNPRLRQALRDVFTSQSEEFERLYGRPPTHVDGHQHRHLCINMVVEEVIPRGKKVRRNFTYQFGEKSFLNRAYRRIVDRLLARRYRITDYFFSLSDCLSVSRWEQVVELANRADVEVMTHPIYKRELEFLQSDEFLRLTQRAKLGSYANLN